MISTLRKAVGFLLIILLLLASVSEADASSFPKLSLTLDEEIRAEEVVEDPVLGRISLSYNPGTGRLDFFDFYITATRAVTGIRYHTPLLWIKVGNYPKFYFDAQALANWQPTRYDSAGQAVRVWINDILNYIIRTDPSVNDETEAAAVLFSHDKFDLGFKVEVYNAGTEDVLGSAEEKEQAEQLLRSMSFSEAHVQDVQKMFQSLPLLIPRVTVSYYEVKEHTRNWGIEYQGKRYEWVRNITFDFIQSKGFGYPETAKYMPAGKESLFTGLEFLCSGITYPPDQATIEITNETSRTVTPTREQSGINVKFYFVKKNLPDFAVTDLIPGTDETEPGKSYIGFVSYMLKEYDRPVEARITLTHNGYSLSTPEGEKIDGQVLTFNPGETKTFSFKYTGQDKDSILRAEIWPTEPSDQEKESRDAYPEDNVLEIKVPRAGYKLTVLKVGQGTTEPPEGEHYYPANEQVDLSATPDPGWKFVRWEGDVSSTNPNTHIVMDSDKRVTAVFEKEKHTLTIRANPNIGGNTNPAPGVYTFEHGETVNVKATPNPGWKFVRWTGNASGTNPNTSVLMDRDKVVIAQFEQDFPAPMDPGDPGGIGEPILLP